MNLESGKHAFISDSLKFLFQTLNLDARPEFDIIFDYEDTNHSTKPFPITYHIDYKKEKLYLISIDKQYLPD